MSWSMMVALLWYSCDHPMIRQREDGTWVCTECGAPR